MPLVSIVVIGVLDQLDCGLGVVIVLPPQTDSPVSAVANVYLSHGASPMIWLPLRIISENRQVDILKVEAQSRVIDTK